MSPRIDSSKGEIGPTKPGDRVVELPDGAPDADGLTARQRKILDVITETVERRGYPPSMREIGEAVGLTSSSSVAHQLSSLERKGFLRRDANRPRAVEVRTPSGKPSGRPPQSLRQTHCEPHQRAVR